MSKKPEFIRLFFFLFNSLFLPLYWNLLGELLYLSFNNRVIE